MSDRSGPEPSASGRTATASLEIEPLDGAPVDASSDGAATPRDVLCPYLIASPGDWRAAMAVREHTCGAVDPAAPVSIDKQRRLCLGTSHVDCATYRAARRALVVDESATSPRPTASTSPHRWPVASTAPVVLDRGGPTLALRLDRTAAQVGLVALMVVAFVVLGVARLSAGGDASPSAAPSQSTAPVATGSPRASATPARSPSAAPTGSPVPTASPLPTGSPTPTSPAASAAPSGGGTTYTVQPGDTLGAIAAAFGTTVKALQELNGIDDPSLIHSGQVLRVP